MFTHLPRRQTRPSTPARQAAASLAAALAAAACALLASAAIIPAAWAMIPYTGGTPAAPTVRVVTEGGMPGWQITLIALSAALVAATTAVLLDRARAARRPSPATTA